MEGEGSLRCHMASKPQAGRASGEGTVCYRSCLKTGRGQGLAFSEGAHPILPTAYRSPPPWPHTSGSLPPRVKSFGRRELVGSSAALPALGSKSAMLRS